MRNTEEALIWVVSILKELNVSFEIDGGLAAEAYGSKRELADIDINVLSEDFDRIVPKVKEYIKFGPAWYQDEHWKLYMMTLKYAGQNIDIGALGGMKFFDKKAKEWKNADADLSACRIINYMGMDLPFVNEIKLMIYKEELARGVDKKDVQAMEDQLKREWSES